MSMGNSISSASWDSFCGGKYIAVHTPKNSHGTLRSWSRLLTLPRPKLRPSPVRPEGGPELVRPVARFHLAPNICQGFPHLSGGASHLTSLPLHVSGPLEGFFYSCTHAAPLRVLFLHFSLRSRTRLSSWASAISLSGFSSL